MESSTSEPKDAATVPTPGELTPDKIREQREDQIVEAETGRMISIAHRDGYNSGYRHGVQETMTFFFVAVLFTVLLLRVARLDFRVSE